MADSCCDAVTITLLGIKDIFDAVEGFSLGIDGASLNFGGLRSDSIRPEDVVAPVISEMLQLVTRNYFVVRVRTLRQDRVDYVVDCAYYSHVIICVRG